MVSQKEIIEALRVTGRNPVIDNLSRKALANRIEVEGIAPPDGWVLVPSSRKLSDAPCDVCGYNGPGYYQPDTHPCAAPKGVSHD